MEVRWGGRSERRNRRKQGKGRREKAKRRNKEYVEGCEGPDDTRVG